MSVMTTLDMARNVKATEVALFGSTYHKNVHSDNAMIDSGFTRVIHTWDRQTLTSRTEEYDCGRGNGYDIIAYPVFNATDEDFQRYVCDLAARNLVREFRSVASRLYFIRSGSYVEVVKGRKVPVGTVIKCDTDVISGTYNPYINGRAADGTYYKYVNTGNVKPLLNEKLLYLAEDYKTIAGFVKDLWTSEFSEFNWLLLCEWMEEKLHDLADVHTVNYLLSSALENTNRSIGTVKPCLASPSLIPCGYFAEALRRLVTREPKLCVGSVAENNSEIQRINNPSYPRRRF